MHKRFNQLNKAFNLLELMAAIVIVGILVGVSVPTYREYQIKAHMVDVLSTLEGLLDVARQEYVNAGTIPASVYDFPTGVLTEYADSACIEYILYDDGSSWANVGHAAMVQALVSQQCAGGIQGFVAGEGGNYNTVTMAFIVVGDNIKHYCGAWVEDDTAIPLDYLPAGCQDTDFATAVTG